MRFIINILPWLIFHHLYIYMHIISILYMLISFNIYLYSISSDISVSSCCEALEATAWRGSGEARHGGQLPAPEVGLELQRSRR